MELLFVLIKMSWRRIQAGIYFFYLATHLVALTALPVFADEAIYIRWAQLIIDDWQSYLFFSLNDGKTPLFIWLMVPFLKVIQDQLLAGRVLSVLAGIAQIWVTKELVQLYGGRRKAQFIGMALTCLLPFWFFYHRIALMDGLLSFFMSVSLLVLTKLAFHIEKKSHYLSADKHILLFTLVAGVSFGLAILTKLPAIFFGPVFVFIAVFPFITHKLKLSFTKIFWIGLAGLIGCLLFLLLKLHPAFSQLFLRGKDFTYTIQDLLGGYWINTFRNIPRFSNWFMFYLTPVVFFSPFVGLSDQKLRKRVGFLLLSAVLFCGPFVVFGKTVYPRYLLPAAVFFTVAASLVSESWLEKQRRVQYFVLFLFGLVFMWSAYNMMLSWVDVDKVLYVPLDREQYQTEWSAGYGVKEAFLFIKDQAKQGKVVVATEGYFGTLPDGILLYLHNQDVNNIEVFGIGEPIRSLPSEFVNKASQAQSAFVMVNSHRMMTYDPRLSKVRSYPRPFNAPSFDIYEFKQ